MPEVRIHLKTGEGKRRWYAYTVQVGDWSSELQFIDKIHYDYLKTVTGQSDVLDLDEE